MYVGYCDGGSRGNPGPSAYAAIIKDGVSTFSVATGFLGVATNNIAEYEGLVALLELALEQGVHELHVYSDSKLMVQQVQGLWKVKAPEIKLLCERARFLIDQFDAFEITHIHRELNKVADALVNDTLDIAQNSK